MLALERIVIDTNVVVSSLFFPNSTPGQALCKAQKQIVLASEATLQELIVVTQRPQWDRYVDRNLRDRLVAEFIGNCKMVPVFTKIRECRHQKDDKFLDLAVDGRADLILTGDKDLLALHPFRGLPILTPADYLART